MRPNLLNPVSTPEWEKMFYEPTNKTHYDTLVFAYMLFFL